MTEMPFLSVNWSFTKQFFEDIYSSSRDFYGTSQKQDINIVPFFSIF